MICHELRVIFENLQIAVAGFEEGELISSLIYSLRQQNRSVSIYTNKKIIKNLELFRMPS